MDDNETPAAPSFEPTPEPPMRGCGRAHEGICLMEAMIEQQNVRELRNVAENAALRDAVMKATEDTTLIVDAPGGPITILTFNAREQTVKHATAVSAIRALDIGVALIEAARGRLHMAIAPMLPRPLVAESDVTPAVEVAAAPAGAAWGDDDDYDSGELRVDRTPWRGI